LSAVRTDLRFAIAIGRQWITFEYQKQHNERAARGIMAKKVEIIAVFALCTAFTAAPGTVSGFPARADDSGVALSSGINQLRQGCGAINDDPRLAEAAQRHANDMLRSGVSGHIGSDGSSPQARITDAGYRSRYSGEIVFWATGSAANPNKALDMWMQSPPHRAIILNCAYNAGGFATAWDGNKMTAVGDFAAS
jgi:uncharacterized protein YkwD